MRLSVVNRLRGRDLDDSFILCASFLATKRTDRCVIGTYTPDEKNPSERGLLRKADVPGGSSG